jgi:hypothetical protein
VKTVVAIRRPLPRVWSVPPTARVEPGDWRSIEVYGGRRVRVAGAQDAPVVGARADHPNCQLVLNVEVECEPAE